MTVAVLRGWETATGLTLGMLADAVWGDPVRHHPVAWFGQWAARMESLMWSDSRTRGAGYLAVTVAPWAVGALAVHACTRRSPLSRVVTTAVVTWAVVGAKSLSKEATTMASLLRDGSLLEARQRLSHLCSRDAEQLAHLDIARATIESVCENTSDAVMAPLVWGAIAGVPGLVVLRAVNTLDAMVGYRNDRYGRFGWASARLDDLMGILPARLTALLTVATAGPGAAPQVWRVWRRDASAHPSPNAGPVEASAAGALQLRLGGAHTHGGKTETRAILGGEFPAPTVPDIERAVRLSRTVAWSGTVVCAALAIGLSAVRGMRS